MTPGRQKEQHWIDRINPACFRRPAVARIRPERAAAQWGRKEHCCSQGSVEAKLEIASKRSMKISASIVAPSR